MEVCSNLVKAGAPEAKKRLGQHFLRDKGVLNRIVRWIDPTPEQVFIEIGAGTGALSTLIAEKAAALSAIELDSDCLPVLEEALAPFDTAVVVPGDILNLDLVELVAEHLQPALSGRHLHVAGNLPYNIGTAIIERLLHSEIPIEAMFFMLQLEVAERILAHPDTREYGYLSVMCQHRADARMGFKVAPACFAPRPKVMSAVISLHPKPQPVLSENPAWEANFEALVKASFAHRRKTLANSLSRSPHFGDMAANLLAQAQIDGARRAENLSIAEYEHLAEIFHREFAEKGICRDRDCPGNRSDFCDIS